MIITRTPFRISLCGGGTDLPDFYSTCGGSVVSFAIDKYINIVVNKRFDNSLRVSYSKTEITENLNDIQHPIVREAMIKTGVTEGIEIVSIADIPAGTGLGSSSSFTVGLLLALYAYCGKLKGAEELAEEACRIEIDILGEPIGKQDQYIAAHGGLRSLKFNPDGSVLPEYITCSPEFKTVLADNLMMFYMGKTGEARNILSEQKANTNKNGETLGKIKGLAESLRHHFIEGRNVDTVGEILHESWILKKQLANGISNNRIDEWYEKARKSGAIGGKVMGAGGRGFLLLYCPRHYQQKVIDNLPELKLIHFNIEPEGSRIIYMTGEH